jgi:hypothetical protein
LNALKKLLLLFKMMLKAQLLNSQLMWRKKMVPTPQSQNLKEMAMKRRLLKVGNQKFLKSAVKLSTKLAVKLTVQVFVTWFRQIT